MTLELQERLSRVAGLRPARRREAFETRRRDGDGIAAALGAEVGRNRYGEHLVARRWYASPQVCEPRRDELRLLLPIKCAQAEQIVEDIANPAKWLFLDTETTGLAGGTGTYAFLIGLAWWESGGIQVEQLFMRDHDEEHAILLELAQRVAERPVLVTFNGKCFDWPLLQNRFRMTRQIEPPLPAAHLDLLHPARQLWRLHVGSAKLAELEERVLGYEKLGWSRQDDIDSSRIPELYFDFLRGAGPDAIAGVLHHNRMDLRGLAALTVRALETLENAQRLAKDGRAPLELYGISRFLSRRGDISRARPLYEFSIAAGLPEPIAHRAKHEAAKLARRDNDFATALRLWRALVDCAEPSFEAFEQLAIHYERREKDSNEALRLTRSALRSLRCAAGLGFIKPKRCTYWSARFQSRLVRLEARWRSRG